MVAMDMPHSELPSASCHGEMRRWYALITRSRHEKAVARALTRLDTVETYVPLRRVWSARKDRRVQIDTPALPGYVFLRTTLWPDTRASIKRMSGVVGLVGAGHRPAPIPPEQIDSLRILLAAAADARLETQFTVGQLVHIKSGYLAGASGTLVRISPNRHRLLVRISHIGLALSAEVHEADVEPLEPAPSGIAT